MSREKLGLLTDVYCTINCCCAYCRYLPKSLVPAAGVRDITNDLLLDLNRSDFEVAEEVTEKSDLDLAAADRYKPLAFCSASHKYLFSVNRAFGSQQSWRMRERMKTVSVALVICLNVGVDPPDVTKTQPCARMEAWVDPNTLNQQKATELIGKAAITLRSAYNIHGYKDQWPLRLSPKAHFITKIQ